MVPVGIYLDEGPGVPRDVIYVEEQVGPETDTTMPPATIEALLDHGRIRPTLLDGIDEAHSVVEVLEDAGVDYGAIVEQLEREGIEKFADAFEQLIDCVSRKWGELEAA